MGAHYGPERIHDLVLRKEKLRVVHKSSCFHRVVLWLLHHHSPAERCVHLLHFGWGKSKRLYPNDGVYMEIQLLDSLYYVILHLPHAGRIRYCR